MLHETLFDRVLAWVVQERGEGPLQAARRAFEDSTGTIDERAADFESRIAHFLEQHVCEGAPPPISAFAAANDLHTSEREELAGWLRSHRSLYLTESLADGQLVLRDAILGGRYRVCPREGATSVALGEYFDGRVVPLAGRLHLSPGRVYHPREAHVALAALLESVDRESLARPALLNALLSMRSRFLKFESVRAEHVYQASALAPVRLPMRPNPR